MRKDMDIELHYTEKGTGSPLILLHGNGEDSGYFFYQTEYFSKEYRVIALDTRGHGKSPRGEKPFTIRQFAEDLHDFLDEQKIEKADILGFSDGGNIALVFSLKYPERVDRLILNGANLYGSGVKPSVQIPVIIGYHAASLLAGKKERRQEEKKNFVRENFAHKLYFIRELQEKALEHAEMLGLMVNDPNLTPEELSENRDPKFLRIPKLLLVGNKDMIKDEHTRLIYASLPNAQIRVIKGSHFAARENPAEFNRLVDEFLKSTEQQGADQQCAGRSNI